MRVRVRDRNMVKVRVATTTYVSNEDAFSARGGLPLFLLAAVLHVIFIVRVRVKMRVWVRVWVGVRVRVRIRVTWQKSLFPSCRRMGEEGCCHP